MKFALRSNSQWCSLGIGRYTLWRSDSA